MTIFILGDVLEVKASGTDDELVYKLGGSYYTVNTLGNTTYAEINRKSDFYLKVYLDCELSADCVVKTYVTSGSSGTYASDTFNCKNLNIDYDFKNGYSYIPISKALNYQQGSVRLYYDVTLANGQVYRTKDLHSNNAFYVKLMGDYTVKYNANGGTGIPEPQTKYSESVLTISSVKPNRVGYTFMGWATSSTATSALYQPGDRYTQNNNITLYAVWSPNQYFVYYDANGGNGAPQTQVKTHGITLVLSRTEPKRTGYTFKGWSINPAATSAMYQPGAKYTTDSRITLYAIWEKNSVSDIDTGDKSGESTGSGNSGSTGSETGSGNSGSTGTETGNSNSGSTGTEAGSSNDGSTGTETGRGNGGSTGAGTNAGGSADINTMQSSQLKKQVIQAVSKTVLYKSKPFYLNAKTNGGGRLTYKSNNKKVADINSKGRIIVRGYGQATITITAEAKGSFLKTVKKVTIKVVPKKQKLKSVSSPGKKKLNISWTKDRTVTGYEVQFSRKKNFKRETYKRFFKAKASSTKLVGVPNKRIYYVRIRSYKTVGKKKYYGAWSKLKQVRVK